MRCPKCGYVSFDHLDYCLKCKKDISAVSNSLHGTVFNVEVPSYLHLHSSRQNEDLSDNDGFVDSLEADEEFIDDDFEVLADDQSSVEGEIEAPDDKTDTLLRNAGNFPDDDEDSEDGEIEIDLSQFERKEEQIEMPPAGLMSHQQAPETQPLSMEFPAELEDVTDLAPPSKGMHSEKSEPKTSVQMDAAESTMDDLDFDLVFGELEADLAKGGSEPVKETTLALDDIDFTEAPSKSRHTKSQGRPGGADMDEDLNFDLDLGGLSIHKDL